MNEINPSISVIMVDGSFRESFFSIDYFENQTLPRDNYEIIWMEYYDDVKPTLAQKVNNYSNFQVLCLGRSGEYHSSYCFNAGIMASKGNILVIPDADIIVEKDFLESILDEHELISNLVIYIYRLDEPKSKHVEPYSLDHLRKVCKLINPINYGGCVSARKKWFIEINGYEQHPVFGSGFHANGLDIYTRFKNLGLLIKWHPKLRIFHPWHPYTLHPNENHTTQKIVIDHRAINLSTLAFQGIDKQRNTDFPSNLYKELNQKKSSDIPIQRLILKIPGISRLVNLSRKIINHA